MPTQSIDRVGRRYSGQLKRVITRSSSCCSRQAKRWDSTVLGCRDGCAMQTLEGHSGYVRSVAFSPDGKQVVSGSYNRTLRALGYSTVTGVPLQILEGHSSYARSVAFSPDGKGEEALFVLNDWVVERKGKIPWLPPEYRETSIAVWNRIIVLGHSSETISILGFAEGLKHI